MAAYAGAVPGLRTGRGCIAGIPDMALVYRGGAYFIEVKARDGLLTPPQQAVASALALAGCRFGVACDADEALALLDAWGIPRTRRVMA